MHSDVSELPEIKLSICITTFNRATVIGATLENILAQLTNACEVVILDASSTDDTEQVVAHYEGSCNRLRYLRQGVNNGWDRDCDRVVELARGDYCWLMTDDDLLKPGAVAKVLAALHSGLSLVFVNSEVRDFTMTKVLQPGVLSFVSDRLYGASETDRLFVDLGVELRYVGAFVIKRSIWIARERQRYYGSLFVHVGVIFQSPLPSEALVIAEPLISYRMGNTHTWSLKQFEVFVIEWSLLVWSLPLSDATKRRVCVQKPWTDFWELLWYRGRGFYSLVEYQRSLRPRLHSMRERSIPALVALLPGPLVNAFWIVYYSVANCHYRGVYRRGMRESRYYFRNLAIFKRATSA